MGRGLVSAARNFQCPRDGDEHLDPAALAAQLQDAHDAIRARDEFLGIAAHELRSPLNALGLQLALIERLVAAKEPDARVLAEVQRARRNIRRYMRRASALLDISRLASGRAEPMLAPVSLRQVVQAVLETYADEADFRGARLVVSIEGDPVGHWDAQMIEEILSNLVSNALRYGAASPVRLAAGADDQGHAWFSVADNGPGIPKEQRTKIFQKFERAVSNSAERGGFGLGLWIVAGMVRAHRGRIEVTANPAGGSVFLVRLPLRPPAPPPPQEKTS